MSLTPQQMRLVKGTVHLLRQHGERISSLLYQSMLAAHPELQNYFNHANMSSGAQPRAMTALILAFASNIHNISDIVQKLERVSNKHASLGIRPEHYDIVGKYLLRAFAEVLGPREMTSEARIAWTKAYWILARMLTTREEMIYRSFASWKGWRLFIIDEKTPETSCGNIVSLTLKPVDGAHLPSFKPGQYISIRVRCPSSGFHQIRQYSLSDAPLIDRYRITVKRVDESRHPLNMNPIHYSPSIHFGPHDETSFSTDGRISKSSSSPASLSIRGFGNLFSRSSTNTSISHPSEAPSAPSTSPGKKGIVSNVLVNDMRPGDVVELAHPSGDFFLDTESCSTGLPLVLISAGIGVTPLLSILVAVLKCSTNSPISWVQGARGERPFEQYVRKLAKSHKNLRASFFDSDMGSRDFGPERHSYNSSCATSPSSNDHQEERQAAYSNDDEAQEAGLYIEFLESEGAFFFENNSTEYYVCGPESFMRDMAEYLRLRGVAPQQVRCDLHSTGFFEAS